MDGFKLCLTNTSTTPPVSDFCYTDPDPGLPNIIQTIPFYHFAKYVIYYDDKGSTNIDGRVDGPVIELCYVAINGCQKGFWGSNCTIKCAENCIEGNCYPGNGSCVWGCDPTNCLNNVCNKDTAECTDGCKEGRTGNHCNKSCDNGNFGTNCSDFCDGCLSFKCNHVDGLCDDKNACNNGYIFGDYCNKACENWYFGNNCSMECNCLAEPCNKVDGICPLGGCKEGWHGDSCSKRCDKGKFGRNCIDSCDGCISNSCDAIDGLCYNTIGCEPGYYFEEYCNNTCDDCFFGTNCSRKCNCLHGPCNWLTGMCPPGGCENGWQGKSCDEVCDDYYFGNNCTKQCHCLEKPCNNDDGICSPEGCKEGWHGKSCDQACDDWYFGNNCAWKCYCLTGPCNLFTGKCPPGGCQKGWHGVTCEVSTVTAENKHLISTQLGLFIGGFLLGILITAAACFLARKRRKLRKKQGKENVTEKTQSHEQQHYDDVRMENISTYQDLMTRQTTQDYEHINTAFVRQ